MAATKITKEVLEKRSQGIRKAKASPEHRKKMSEITKGLWRDPSYRAKQSNRKAWNKLPDSAKILKRCEECNIEFYVVPSRIARKYCSKKCTDVSKIGNPHLNWNPNSLNGSGYKQCLKGWYKDKRYTFRSSYELSALVQLLDDKREVEVEPFYVWYEYKGKPRRYFPDLLVDGNLVVEIKPAKFVDTEINLLKFVALEEWCKENNCITEIWTEKNIKILSKEEISELVKTNKVFLTEGITPCNRKKKQ
jgi:hypothetical protein